MRTCAAGAAYARLLAITFIPLEFDGVELGCGALRPNGNEARMHCAAQRVTSQNKAALWRHCKRGPTPRVLLFPPYLVPSTV
jgi:hypothetical protein